MESCQPENRGQALYPSKMAVCSFFENIFLKAKILHQGIIKPTKITKKTEHLSENSSKSAKNPQLVIRAEFQQRQVDGEAQHS